MVICPFQSEDRVLCCPCQCFTSLGGELCRINRQQHWGNSSIRAGGSSGSTAHIPLSQAGNPWCSHTGSKGPLSQGGSGLDQGSVELEAGGRREDMCLMLGGFWVFWKPVLSLGLSFHPAKGGTCHQGSREHFCFWVFAVVIRASCAPSSCASTIRPELSRGPWGASPCLAQGAALRKPWRWN